MTKFNHLNIPDQWNTYWSKYPQGYTILEALINWVGQVDSMVDNQNQLNDNVVTYKNDINNTITDYRNELDSFVLQFDTELQETVSETLTAWQLSGYLEVIISAALQTQIDEVDERLSTQLAENTKKLTGSINVAEYGILSDGTDQTTPLVDLFTIGLLSSLRGFVTIPYNTKFNLVTFYSSIPSGVVVKDYSAINFQNSEVYKNKFFTIGSSDAYEDDKIVMIQSGHHPVLSLNNFQTALSDSANNARSTIEFANGVLNGYQNVLQKIQFTKHQLYDKWAISFSMLQKYGSTAPNPTTMFYADEDGNFAIGAPTNEGVNLRIRNSPNSQNNETVELSENINNSSKTRKRMQAKDVNGVTTEAEIQFNGAVVDLRFFLENSFKFSIGKDKNTNKSAKGVDWKILESSATPNVENGEYFDCNLANTTIPELTNLVTSILDVEITIFFTSDTPPTVVGSTSLRLQGGLNWTPSKYSSLTLYKRSALTGAWFEKSRNEM